MSHMYCIYDAVCVIFEASFTNLLEFLKNTDLYII